MNKIALFLGVGMLLHGTAPAFAQVTRFQPFGSGAHQAMQRTAGLGSPVIGVSPSVPIHGSPGGHCRPDCHRPCPPRVVLPIYSTYPFGIGYGYGYNLGYGGFGSGYYGNNGYVDDLQEQNARLRRRVDDLERRNDAQDRAKANNPVRVNVPVRRQQASKARADQLSVAGVRLFASGAYGRSADRFSEAIRFDPTNASAYFYLAQARFAQQRYADAADALKKGLEANPEWIELDFDVRTLYDDENEFQRQIGELAALLRDQPLRRDALFVLGFELFATGQKKKARAVLEQSARLEVDDAHIKPFFDYFEKAEAEAAPLVDPTSPRPGQPNDSDV